MNKLNEKTTGHNDKQATGNKQKPIEIPTRAGDSTVNPAPKKPSVHVGPAKEGDKPSSKPAEPGKVQGDKPAKPNPMQAGSAASRVLPGKGSGNQQPVGVNLK